MKLKQYLGSVCAFLAISLAYATPSAQAVPVVVQTKTVAGVGVRVVQIDLSDPNNVLTIFLANNSSQANSAQASYGDEAFGTLVSRAKAAAVINGTFFSKDAELRVMGNMVRAGEFVKYSQWENYGTTLGLKAGNVPEMVTARVDGRPNWESHFFSITCGPRLLKDGKVWLNPSLEGFADPHVLGAGARSAIGFSQNGKTLYLVSFNGAVSLQKEAEAMKALGAYQAMNLDGGASKALAVGGRVVVPAGRKLTNVIAVYDQKFPAPGPLKQAFKGFSSMASAGGQPASPPSTPPSPAKDDAADDEMPSYTPPASQPHSPAAAPQPTSTEISQEQIAEYIALIEQQLEEYGDQLSEADKQEMLQALEALKQMQGN